MKKPAEILKLYQEKTDKFFEKYRKARDLWRYTEISLTLFATAFFVIFAIRPAVATISGLAGEIREKEAISLEMRKKINAVIAAQEGYALIQENTVLIDSFLPTDFNLGQGLAQILGSADEGQVISKGINLSGLDLIGESRETRQKKAQEKKSGSVGDRLAEVVFNFSGKSSYSDFRKFIELITGTRRWTELAQYQVSKEEKEGENLLNVIIKGKLFYWDDQ